jgi:Bacterial Ig-like domain (group 1)
MTRLLLGTVLVVSSCGTSGGPGVDAGTRAAPDAAKSTVVVSKQTAVADNSDAIEVTVTVRDSMGAPLGDIVVVVSDTGASSAQNRSRTGSDGTTKASLRSNIAETRTVLVTAITDAGTVTLDAKPMVTFVAGPLARLRFAVQPTEVRVGAPITPPVRIAAEDALGNPVASSDVTVSVRLVRTMMASGLSGGAAKMISDGGVVFDALTLGRAENGVALRAEASNGNAVESMTFNVIP